MQILWGTKILYWMLLMQNAQNRSQERLTMCLKSLPQSLECWHGSSLCQKHFTKTILYTSWKYFPTCSTQPEINLNDWWVSMGIFPDDLEQVYDNVTEHKLHKTGGLQNSSKTDWLEQCKVVPIILCQFWNCLLWKQWFVKNLTVLWML